MQNPLTGWTHSQRPGVNQQEFFCKDLGRVSSFSPGTALEVAEIITSILESRKPRHRSQLPTKSGRGRTLSPAHGPVSRCTPSRLHLLPSGRLSGHSHARPLLAMPLHLSRSLSEAPSQPPAQCLRYSSAFLSSGPGSPPEDKHSQKPPLSWLLLKSLHLSHRPLPGGQHRPEPQVVVPRT